EGGEGGRGGGGEVGEAARPAGRRVRSRVGSGGVVGGVGIGVRPARSGGVHDQGRDSSYGWAGGGYGRDLGQGSRAHRRSDKRYVDHKNPRRCVAGSGSGRGHAGGCPNGGGVGTSGRTEGRTPGRGRADRTAGSRRR